MENYIVSARKYRPITFRSVVGQGNLTTTLKNAIETNHLAHAYLFCGPRGVGKTTCARIFAKTINCLNPTPEGDACNECESCKAFIEQRSFNIHELDAASNNSVDDIRSLTDQVRIPPQIGKYSVYIIDEVHMLSQAAFNAFLKTLEEPPAHAIFILATTEKQKVIPTILSRCQIYDFNRIGVTDIVDYLSYIAEQEGIKAEREALEVIAKKADGGMRDALSIFDQVVSFCGNEVTYQQVIAELNVLDYEYYFKLVDLFRENKVGQALLVLDEILNKGFDLQNFVQGLTLHLRDLMVSRDSETTKLMEVSADTQKRYIEQARNCTLSFLYNGMMLANDCDKDFKLSKNKRLLVEILLIKLCQLSNPVEAVNEKKNFDLKPITVEAETPAPTRVTPTPAPAPAPKPAPAPEAVTPQATAPEPPAEPSPATPAPTPAPQERGLKLGKINLKGNISITPLSAPKPVETTAEETPAPETQQPAPSAEGTFTYEALLKEWDAFARSILKNKKLTVTLQNFHPKPTDDGKYIVELVNQGQKKDVDTILPKLLKHLSSKLQAPIAVTTKLVEGEFHKKAFTAAEIWTEWEERNPDLKTFRDKMQLELK